MSHLIVGLGEILWDVFPHGAKLGGAPLNFSCSAAELAGGKAEVVMVSAVGDDEMGRQAVKAIQQHGVQTESVQTNESETGQVLVELDSAGVASYRFAENSAWDHLTWNDDLQRLALKCSAVCFGTLGQRATQSRGTIQKFVAVTSETALRIFDINIRRPFYSEDIIRESLALANLLKLNEDELPELAAMCGLDGTNIDIMQQLADVFQLRGVALTQGSAGAILMWDGNLSEQPGIEVQVADTVGAGDAYTASMALGLLGLQDIDDVNRQAVKTAAYVCSQPGATMSFPW